MHEIFDEGVAQYRGRLVIGGRPHNSSAVTGDYLPQLKKVEEDYGRVHLLRVGFKNDRLIDFGDPSSFEHELVGARESVRALTMGDVGFVPWDASNRVVLAFLNADSPFDVITTRRGVYALHGGFACLCPFEGGASVLDICLEHMRVQGDFDNDRVLAEVAMFFGGGIESCCYGMSGDHLEKHLKAMAKRFSGEMFPLELATKGPRQGQIALDLSVLFLTELQRANPGLRSLDFKRFIAHRTRWSRECTACQSDEAGNRQYWSHVYDADLKTPDGTKPLNPRNFTAWVIDREL